MIYINILLWLLTITTPLWVPPLYELLSEYLDKELAKIDAENQLRRIEESEKDGSANRIRQIIIQSKNITDPAEIERLNSINYFDLLLLHR